MDFTAAHHALATYNHHGLHYNLVADGVYAARERIGDPLSAAYRPYLIAALISFDMGRQLDAGSEAKYGARDDQEINTQSFAYRLQARLRDVAPLLRPLMQCSLVDVALDEHADAISNAYTHLAMRGEHSLSTQGKAFEVGATKILHFLNPELFLIIDRYAGQSIDRARLANGSPVRSGRRGDGGAHYVQALESAQAWIIDYGVDRFRALEPGTPLMRIFDKIAFARGTTSTAALV